MQVIRKEQTLEVWKHVDIVVAGGGPAGVGAAGQPERRLSVRAGEAILFGLSGLPDDS